MNKHAVRNTIPEALNISQKSLIRAYRLKTGNSCATQTNRNRPYVTLTLNLVYQYALDKFNINSSKILSQNLDCVIRRPLRSRSFESFDHVLTNKHNLSNNMNCDVIYVQPVLILCLKLWCVKLD